METTGIQCILFLFHSISPSATKSMPHPYISSPNLFIRSLTLIQLERKREAISSHLYTYSFHQTQSSDHIPAFISKTTDTIIMRSDQTCLQNKPMTLNATPSLSENWEWHHLTLLSIHLTIAQTQWHTKVIVKAWETIALLCIMKQSTLNGNIRRP